MSNLSNPINNINELFFITLIAIIAMVFGYTFSVERRTLKLEKKNGHEQHQINQLKKEVALLEAENKELKELSFYLKKKIQELEKKIKSYEKP